MVPNDLNTTPYTYPRIGTTVPNDIYVRILEIKKRHMAMILRKLKRF